MRRSLSAGAAVLPAVIPPTLQQLGKTVQTVAELCIKSGITMREAEVSFRKHMIRAALAQAKGNQCHAATLLGWHRNTLSRMMDVTRIDAEEFRGRKSA